MRSFFRSCIRLLFIASSAFSPLTAQSDGSLTSDTVERMRILNGETGYYCGYVAQSLIRCSQHQDLWLAYLHKVGSVEEYHDGMRRMHAVSSSFRSSCRYASEGVNFFNPYEERFLQAQSERWEVVEGEHSWDRITYYTFLNTFKTGTQLTAQEREYYFQQEWDHYQRDAVVAPFLITPDSLQELQPEAIYNYALLDDGTMRAALEKPGRIAYYTQGAVTGDEPFEYPNHTILAGSPHQRLLSGGSFLFFQVEDRRLYFVSNKSGHFVPYFHSLDKTVDAFEALGIN
jgi:hypothetical protein